MRKQVSCRFAPYYRVQMFDALAIVWRPQRGTYTTEAKARESAAKMGGKTRVEIVTEDGRKFV